MQGTLLYTISSSLPADRWEFSVEHNKKICMIPKIIHYCWFGSNKKPRKVRKCIATWKKLLPDYEFIEWNEDNFDINMIEYAKEAYNEKKYAFVSDVARLYALLQFGGIYMDTDVELLKPLDSFLNHRAFCGFESENFLSTAMIGADKGSEWIQECWSLYDGQHFASKDGTLNMSPNVILITRLTREKVNLRFDNSFQDYDGYLTIYPIDYFSPLDFETKILRKTSRSVCIHHFEGSWLTPSIPSIKEVGFWKYLRIKLALRTRIMKLFDRKL